MSTYKITIILTNEIPNQPPFGIALLFDDMPGDKYGALYNLRLHGEAANLCELVDFEVTIDYNLEYEYDWDSYLPIGFKQSPKKPIRLIRLNLKDKKTGYIWQIVQLFDQLKIEPYNGDGIENNTKSLMESNQCLTEP